MESKVPSTIKTPVFRPKFNEFADFPKFIRDIEKKNINFALVSMICVMWFCVFRNDNGTSFSHLFIVLYQFLETI